MSGLRWEKVVAQDGAVVLLGWSGDCVKELMLLRPAIWPTLSPKRDPLEVLDAGR